jgi:hypothetical protein
VTLTTAAETPADAEVKLGWGLATGLESGATDLAGLACQPSSRRPAQ